MRIVPSVDDLSSVWRLLVLRAGIVLALSVASLPWPAVTLTAIVVLVSATIVIAALLDAALSGALQLRAAGGWALLPEAPMALATGRGALLPSRWPVGEVIDRAAQLLRAEALRDATPAKPSPRRPAAHSVPDQPYESLQGVTPKRVVRSRGWRRTSAAAPPGTPWSPSWPWPSSHRAENQRESSIAAAAPMPPPAAAR